MNLARRDREDRRGTPENQAPKVRPDQPVRKVRRGRKATAVRRDHRQSIAGTGLLCNSSIRLGVGARRSICVALQALGVAEGAAEVPGLAVQRAQPDLLAPPDLQDRRASKVRLVTPDLQGLKVRKASRGPQAPLAQRDQLAQRGQQVRKANPVVDCRGP